MRMFPSAAAIALLLAAIIGVAATRPAAADLPPKLDASLAKTLADESTTDYWVVFAAEAELADVRRVRNWEARGEAVVDALSDAADQSQAAVRARLRADRVEFDPYFISNAIYVHDGSEALAEELAKRPEVERVAAPRTVAMPEPPPGVAEAQSVAAVEWGIDAINADDVWSTYGVRGEGIVVAHIDTGVQFDHPALARQYRGNSGGTIDHNYNWFDPSGTCGTPSETPCDPNGHGTHTMGTMVGDDGAGNQIGVAPGARWIAAKGCSSTCADADLLAAGQWILAPTDLSGNNPRPDLRPNIVNNSWGGGSSEFLREIVDAWRAAGIFPAALTGNGGPDCNSDWSPGNFVANYASGSFDIDGNIASFSSRGPGEDGTVKPDLAAPGVAIRSSVPGNEYALKSGTSMASPHTAATVALMWSAAPALVGNVAYTEDLLDGTAVDVDDTTCGGTTDDNNVWGEGKLDALAAVTSSPRGPVGRVAGTVTDAVSRSPISGAAVHVAGPPPRDLVTGVDGAYAAPALLGDSSVTVSAFGYAGKSSNVVIVEGQTTTRNFSLKPLTRRTVSGRVVDTRGQPVANARVELLGTPIEPELTGPDGRYSMPNVPFGGHELRVTAGCFVVPTRVLTVDGNETANFTLVDLKDAFGYGCQLGTAAYREGDTPVALFGNDRSTAVALPFAFPFYGESHQQLHVSTNGNLQFGDPSGAYENVEIPSADVPNAAIYPFWDDLYIDENSTVLTGVSGSAPNREFLIEWRNAQFSPSEAEMLRVDFEVVLFEDGRIEYRYRNLDPAQPWELGKYATVGIENATGTDALQFSFNEPALADGKSIRFIPPDVFPRTGVLDTFNRANGAVGGNWRGLAQSSFYRVAGNRLDVQYGGPIYWNTAFGSTQEAFVTLSAIDSGSRSQGLLLKVGDGNIADAAAITVTYDARARAVTVSALRAGARSWTFYPAKPVTFSNGDQLGARATSAGVVQIRRNGSLVASVSLNAADQAYFNGRGGKIGISTLNASTAFLDDFGGGTAAP